MLLAWNVGIEKIMEATAGFGVEGDGRMEQNMEATAQLRV